MAKKKEQKKVKRTAKVVMLNSDRALDREAVKHLAALRDAVPGLSELTDTMRWLCENEVPLIIEKYQKMTKGLKAS